MKFLFAFIAILIQCGFIFGQDGSDMNYIKIGELNESFIGRKLHIDFGQRSFAFSDYDGKKRPLDTVTIEVKGKKIKFIEHRVDDGYNNWFIDQYLESVEEIDKLKLRVKEFELLKIHEKDILVKGFFVFVDKKAQILTEKSFTIELSFEIKEIVELLFKAED